jgi:hypothetical protein
LDDWTEQDTNTNKNNDNNREEEEEKEKEESASLETAGRLDIEMCRVIVIMFGNELYRIKDKGSRIKDQGGWWLF